MITVVETNTEKLSHPGHTGAYTWRSLHQGQGFRIHGLEGLHAIGGQGMTANIGNDSLKGT